MSAKRPSKTERMVAHVALYFLNAWVDMLLLGEAHGTDQRVPALGYWAVLILTIVLVSPAYMAAHVFHNEGNAHGL